MKTSKTLMEILSNFAKINPGIKFVPGSVLKTRHQYGQIPMAKAEIADAAFPTECVIHDLPKLIGVLSMFPDAEINFDTDQLEISSVGSKRSAQLKYGSDRVVICADYAVEPKFSQVDIQFTLDESDFKYLMKSVGTFSSPEVAIIGDGSKLTVSTHNTQNKAADKSDIEVGVTDKKFIAIINSAHFFFLPRTYQISLNFKGLVEFKSVSDEATVTYWITATEKSKFP